MEGLLRGERVDDKYLIEALIGEGGMGAVYRATHLGTTRTVALKIIHSRFSSNEEFVERFRREAEAAGRLHHPNVVDVTDFGFAQTSGGRVAYLVMEHLDGCTLGEILEEERRMSTSWVVDILEQVCSAVDAAHRRGIVHRDLKPENIWLEPNRRGGYTVKVLDFGLAKLGDRTEPVAAAPIAAGRSEAMTMVQPSAETMSGGATRAGAVIGTPLYMSPEQCRGERLDARSDIYSLGVIAYRMLAGDTPFEGSAAELIQLHVGAEAPPISEKTSRIPRRMATVIMTALSKDPARRPEGALGFGSALRASAEGSGTLLRQAVSLYSEHFPSFLAISLFAHAPLIVFVGFFNLLDRDLLPIALGALKASVGPLLFIMMVTATLFGYFTVSAAVVPLVVQVVMAPLREVRIALAFAALKRRWRTFVACTLAVIAWTLVGTVLFVVPGVVVAISHVLYAPVVMVEGTGVRDALKRARRLAKRFWSTVLVITVVQFTLPVLVWVASVDSSLTLKFDEHFSPKQFGFEFRMGGTSTLYQLFNILVAPLAAIMGAQLYLKTRFAGGEVLSDAVTQFEALDIPRSRWQARMRRTTTMN